MKNTELYHYGVPGMKWGHRKSRKTNKIVSKNKINKKKSSSVKKESNFGKYYNNTITNIQTLRLGLAAKSAGSVLKNIGQDKYSKYKNGATPRQTATIKGLGYASEALDIIGDSYVYGSIFKQYSARNEYIKGKYS